MPGNQLARSLACENEKAHEQVTTGSPENTGIPCANGFNRLFHALPGEPGLLSPSPRNATHCRELTPASGRQDHMASPSAYPSHALRGISVHRPLPRVRGDREPPLSQWDRMREGVSVICPTGQGYNRDRLARRVN
jgi:hypothetical protein